MTTDRAVRKSIKFRNDDVDNMKTSLKYVSISHKFVYNDKRRKIHRNTVNAIQILDVA